MNRARRLSAPPPLACAVPGLTPRGGDLQASSWPGVVPGSRLTQTALCPGSTLTVSPRGFPRLRPPAHRWP